MGCPAVRVRESICIFTCGENYGSHQWDHWWQELSAGQFLCYRFDSLLLHKKDTPSGCHFYGAGYGNRTRLHGLGSRCITDIRTLRTRCIIPNQNSNFNPFLSTTQNKNAADCRPRQSHTISESQRRRIPRCSTAFPHTEQPRGPVRSCQESGWSHSQLHSLP